LRPDSDALFVEDVRFNAGYWTPINFRVASAEREDIGDDRGLLGEQNEFIFATNGNDRVFSDVGYNI